MKFGKWYFGWNIVFAASMITLLTVGLRMGIGPFFNPILTNLDMSRTVLSTCIAVSMIVYGIGMPLAGMISKRYSTKVVLLLGVAIICGSIIWTISTESIIAFFASYGVLLSLGLAFTSPVAMTSIVGQWFIRQRGKALFFLSTGSMAGIAIVTPLSAILINQIGWQKTLLCYALIFIILIVPSAIFIMKDDVPNGADCISKQSTIDDGKLKNNIPVESKLNWREDPYWKICFGLFACGYSMNLLGSHGVPMLVDHQFNTQIASYGIGLIGIVAIFSTVILGSISDHYPRKTILTSIYIVRGLGFLGLVFAATTWQLYLVTIIGGLVWAGSTALSSALIGDFYGAKSMSLLYGWAYFGHQIGAAIGSFLGGWGYEMFGTHTVSFGSAALLLIIAGWISAQIPKDTSLVVSLISKKGSMSNVGV